MQAAGAREVTCASLRAAFHVGVGDAEYQDHRLDCGSPEKKPQREVPAVDEPPEVIAFPMVCSLIHFTR